ncbi:MAG: cyclomaltodextrinase N-terminal domain-containing protein, partial [Acidobacteriota bacterium]
MNPNSFPRALRHFLVYLAVGCISLPIFSANRSKRKHAVVPQGKPTVQQAEPPNWWSNLPNPMVLLYGRNLTDAHISCSVAGVSVRRIRISQNGHWAFVWLDTSDAPPQHFDLVIRTSAGQTRVPYELDKMHDPSQGFHGFTPADVMYLIMPDRFSQGNSAAPQLPKTAAIVDRSNPHDYHGGDLRGIENHLDYLKQLGVTTLWITPLYAPDPTSEDYDGYEPV